ncbi:unnamed protein product [Brachionus calyciflorus]|uniref:Alpha/beta hydrolase fold-3 domain-containing protein n=1 Tax=Brachionus calyciflorus TaxID=104777 RepID=A0A813TDR9_9BILA|nr:unnamed protein product [Brachionus calyciflorus]
MLSKKLAIFIALVSVLFLDINKIYVKHDFEESYKYRLCYFTTSTLSKLANLVGTLNLVPEYKFLRDSIDYLSISGLNKSDQSVNIEFKNFNNVNVQIYRPNNNKNVSPLGVLIFIHGGCYFVRNLDSYDSLLSTIVKETNLLVISINYRLAPEHPYPIPTDDCWNVVEYVLKNAQGLNINPEKLILAGDSAGGNAAMVLSKRLAKEKKIKPLFQVLIYPWVQLAFTMPSSLGYKGGFISALDITKAKLWYLGLNEVSAEMKAAITSNNHTLLLSEGEKNLIESYMDVNLIPDKYKIGKSYYDLYKNLPLFNTGTLDPNNILVRDKNFADKVKMLFSEKVSPSLDSLDQLKYQPKTYQITCEWDSLKDEGLILAERMKQAGVDVEMAFYEDCFHGMITFSDASLGFVGSKKIVENLILYIKKNI